MFPLRILTTGSLLQSHPYIHFLCALTDFFFTVKNFQGCSNDSMHTSLYFREKQLHAIEESFKAAKLTACALDQSVVEACEGYAVAS